MATPVSRRRRAGRRAPQPPRSPVASGGGRRERVAERSHLGRHSDASFTAPAQLADSFDSGSAMENHLKARQAQDEVMAIKDRLAKVLEDYEETTKPPMQTTDDDMSQMDPNAFKEAATVMQEEFDSMLNRLEYRKKHRQTALDSVQTALTKLTTDKTSTPAYLAKLEERSKERGKLLALRGPGTDIGARRAKMMRMSSSKLNVRSDGIEKAFDLANAAKQKMTSMHHTLFDFLRMKEDSAGDTIRMFKQKVRELLAQLDSLQEDIRLKDRQSERYEAHIKSMGGEMAGAEAALRRLNRELDQIRPKLETSERAYEDLKARKQKVDTELKSAMMVADRATRDAAKLKREKDIAEHGAQQLNLKVKELQATVKLLEGQAGSSSSAGMSDVLQELQRLKAELDEEKAARAEAVEAARLEGREAAEAMGASTWEEKLNSLQSRYDRDVGAEREKQAALMARVQEMQDRLGASKRELQAAQVALAEKPKEVIKEVVKEVPAAPGLQMRPPVEVEEITRQVMPKVDDVLMEAVINEIVQEVAHEKVVEEVATEKAMEELRRVSVALEKSQKAAAEAERRASQAVSKETDEMKAKMLQLEQALAASKKDLTELQETHATLQANHASLQTEFGSTKQLLSKATAQQDELALAKSKLEASMKQLQKQASKKRTPREVHDDSKLKKTVAEQQDEIVELRDVKARLIRQNTALSEKYDQDTARLKGELNLLAAKVVPEPEDSDLDDDDLAAKMRLKVSKADMYSDMVDAATSPRPPAVSSIATQTRHTGAVAQVRSPQAAGSKLSKAESVSEAIGKWSNERLVKEYQVLRRKAWGIRNENAKLVAEIQELTARLANVSAVAEQLQRDREVDSLIANALSRFPSSKAMDMLPAIAGLRASLQHKLVQVRGAARDAVASLNEQLHHQARDNATLQRELVRTQSLWSHNGGAAAGSVVGPVAGSVISETHATGLNGGLTSWSEHPERVWQVGDGDALGVGSPAGAGAGGGGGGGSSAHAGGGGGDGAGSIVSAATATTPSNKRSAMLDGADGAAAASQALLAHQRRRHPDDKAWLSLGMAPFDPHQNVNELSRQLNVAHHTINELRTQQQAADEDLELVSAEAAEWKNAAHKLDAKLKTYEKNSVLYDQLDQETDFMSAVNVLLREADNLKQTLESGHVSFKYMNRLCSTLRSRCVMSLGKIRNRLQRRRAGRPRLPEDGGSSIMSDSASVAPRSEVRRQSLSGASVMSSASQSGAPLDRRRGGKRRRRGKEADRRSGIAMKPVVPASPSSVSIDAGADLGDGVISPSPYHAKRKAKRMPRGGDGNFTTTSGAGGGGGSDDSAGTPTIGGIRFAPIKTTSPPPSAESPQVAGRPPSHFAIASPRTQANATTKQQASPEVDAAASPITIEDSFLPVLGGSKRLSPSSYRRRGPSASAIESSSGTGRQLAPSMSAPVLPSASASTGAGVHMHMPRLGGLRSQQSPSPRDGSDPVDGWAHRRRASQLGSRGAGGAGVGGGGGGGPLSERSALPLDSARTASAAGMQSNHHR